MSNAWFEGTYIFNCLLLTWISINLSPDYKRSVGLPIFASIAHISGVLSLNTYPATDSPRYTIGNSVSLSYEALALIGVGAIYVVLRRRNLAKEKLIAQGATENGKEATKFYISSISCNKMDGDSCGTSLIVFGSAVNLTYLLSPYLYIQL